MADFRTHAEALYEALNREFDGAPSGAPTPEPCGSGHIEARGKQ